MPFEAADLAEEGHEDIMRLAGAGLVDLAKEKGRKKAPRVADELRLEIVV